MKTNSTPGGPTSAPAIDLFFSRIRPARTWALQVPLFILAFVAVTVASAAERPSTPATAPDGSRIVIETPTPPKPIPVFFSATAEQTIAFSPAEISGEIRLKLHVVQGRPEMITLGLSGDGDIVDVSGRGLRDWSVRQVGTGATAKRFLDLRTLLIEPMIFPPPPVPDLEIVIRTRVQQPAIPGLHTLLVLAPGDAVGFSAKISLQPDSTLDLSVTTATGLAPLDDSAATASRYLATGESRLAVRLAPRGGANKPIELLNAQLTGQVSASGKNIAFHLRGQVRAQKAGARLPLLSGNAALTDKAAGEGWHVELVPNPPGRFTYELVADREGAVPLDLAFATVVLEEDDWRGFDFTMPAGAVVPLRLEGLERDVTFQADLAVVPALRSPGEGGPAPAPGASVGSVFVGFLPADGHVTLAWKKTREAAEGALFFTSTEQSELRLGAGLLRQVAQLSLRVLQGKLVSLRIKLDGPGEIVGVEGTNVVGWHVIAAEKNRTLEVQFSRPIEAEGAFTIQSQTELGNWPVRVEPLRLTPEGGVRHSGFVRVANSGAVRLEIADATGMMQLAPTQFPGGPVEAAARQVFVYRFPSATRDFRILASQIQAEVSVSAITTYELTETARVISAALELDIREAPLRDWSLRVPEDYTVVAVNGSDVADYVAETEAVNGYRNLRVLFGRAIEGRQLLQLRLEKNQSAAAGDWTLPALQFPGAKSVRGHVGAVTTPGYRLTTARVDRLVEVPLSFFPRQTAGLQQAWRLREPDWAADLRIEAMGQTIQADVFHLYSLKEGIVTASILFNYFVVGAPATEWRIEVPASAGNIDVVGQNVRRDWRREGDQVIVSLHQPVLGTATLLVTFEQPMSARGGVIQPGLVRPLGVQAERGFLQVVSPLQVKSNVRRIEGGLLKLEPTELPAEFRLLTSSPSLAVYQYTARPFGLEMNIEWFTPGETVDQVVDFAQLSSQVARDGQVVTEARFFVKTRGRKALRLTLPGGVKLWEARVDNELVNARSDGEQTLIPLPARNNPNEPVVVALRLGQAATAGSTIVLAAPRATATTAISEWVVRGDTDRQLVPRGGNAEPLQPALTETGFEWIATRGLAGTFALLASVVAAVWLLRLPEGWRAISGLLMCGVTAGGALLMTGAAWLQRRPNLSELTYSATMVPANETVTLQLDNLPDWRALIVSWGVVALVAGLACFIVATLLRRSGFIPDASSIGVARKARPASIGLVLDVAGVVFSTTGLLAQRGGAVPFFIFLGWTVFFAVGVPGLRRWRREEPNEVPPAAEPGPGAAPVVSIIAILFVLGLGFGGAKEARAQDPGARAIQAGPTAGLLPALPASGVRPAQAALQTWSIRKDRLFAELDLTVQGQAGDSFALLRPPAVLTEFKADGLRVGKVEREGQTAYYVALERAGVATARVRFEMPLVDRTQSVPLPTGPAATQRVTIELDQAGWEFSSPTAMLVEPTPGLDATHSGATLVLAATEAPSIRLQPKRRDIGSETSVFFAEAENLYVPGPGVVNGFTRVTIRPAQGRVTALDIDVPTGLTVGDVKSGPVGTWRFDPEKRRLHVAIEPAQAEAFTFNIETQLGTGDLPFSLAVEPLKVVGAAGDVGLLALAFGGDAQPEGIRATSLSAVSVQDFDAKLLPRAREGQPLATLQQVWRYSGGGGRVELKVAPVAPEVRVATRQIVSLDDDRMVMAIELHVAITRVGLFKLSFALPPGLEIEALSGAALSHWTEAQEGADRIVTLHLNGRTIGEQAFSLTLAGPAPGAQASWAFPRVVLREATRQTGDVLLVPGRGLRLRAVDRERVTQLDPRTVGGMQPGTLAFRLLQENWVLNLGIEVLDPWVTVQALQDVTVREGQTLTHLNLRYRVENAAVKQVQVRLPGLDAERQSTVRATGSAVSDIVRVANAPDTWEIRFQRGIAGDADVQIEFQGPATRESGRELVVTPEFIGSRQVVQFVAIRGGGRLELEASALPRGWTVTDWSAVPATLQQRSDRSMPTLCFRVAEPEAGLAVVVRRHDVAAALKLRVTQGELTTLFAPTGASLTAVELKVDVMEKGTLQVRLPSGARLFNTFVNGESVAVVREGDAWLFHVTPNNAADHLATVRMVYSATLPAHGKVALLGPSLSVPLENVSWRVVLPPGYELDDYSGGLRLQAARASGSFGLDEYRSLVVSKRSAEAKKAIALLQEANTLLQKGEQQKAGEALSRASNANVLDEAANEDARVQLRNLKTQQTVLGLNTRRQKIYLDNRADATRNEQLERAASLNPFMQGKDNFDPQQVDQLLMGNTAEENTALRGIATKIVEQQLSAEPAPGAIDVTLPERGEVLTFTRSLQVDGSAPLALNLEIDRVTRANWITNTLLLLAVAGVGAVLFAQRTNENPAT